MKKNLGTADRIIRAAVGLGLLSLVVFAEGTAALFGWIGIVPLLTAILGFCPAYLPFGVNTCPRPQA